jgi:hypothetical protein
VEEVLKTVKRKTENREENEQIRGVKERIFSISGQCLLSPEELSVYSRQHIYSEPLPRAVHEVQVASYAELR